MKDVDDDGKVSLHEIGTYNKEEAMDVTADGDEIVSDWKVYKGKAPAKLQGWNMGCPSPLDSKSWAWEALRGAVLFAMRLHYAEHKDGDSKVTPWENPRMLRSAEACGVGELVLPAASLRIERKSHSDAVSLGIYALGDDDNVELFMHPSITNPFDKDGKKSPAPWICPFWWVSITNIEDEANMKMELKAYKIGDLTVNMPMVRNHKEIEDNVPLLCLAEAAAPASAPAAAAKASTPAAPVATPGPKATPALKATPTPKATPAKRSAATAEKAKGGTKREKVAKAN